MSHKLWLHTAESQVTLSASLHTLWAKLRQSDRSLTAEFTWAAACVISQANNNFTGSSAHRHGHTGAVILHWDDRVVVAAIHAAGVPGSLPHLAMRAGNAGTVSAGCQQKSNLKSPKQRHSPAVLPKVLKGLPHFSGGMQRAE